MTTTADSVRVRCVTGEAEMSIAVTVAGATKLKQRAQAEPLAKVLGRLRLQFGPKPVRPPAKKKQAAPAGAGDAPQAEDPPPPPPAVEVLLLGPGGEALAEELPNSEAWVRATALRIGEQLVPVVVNVPTVAGLRLPQPVLAGVPTFPVATLEFADEARVQWRWELRAGDGEPTVVGTERFFTALSAHVGAAVAVTCTPVGASGVEGTPLSTAFEPVTAGPALTPAPLRAAEAPRTSGELRVVTFNILADRFCDSEWGRETLYPHCPPQFLRYGYRKQLLAREIAAYDADIVALQEVDKPEFDEYLVPYLGASGLRGLYGNKSSSQPIGNAVLYQERTFELIENHVVNFTTVWRQYPQLAALGEAFPAVAATLESCTTTGQVVLLRHRASGERICVLNNHLYGHPRAVHIRILQMQVLLLETERLVGRDHALVLCGDLNCGPECGALQLATTGRLGADHPDWTEAAGFRQPANNEERAEQFFKDFEAEAPTGPVAAADLAHSFTLTSATAHLGLSFYVGGPVLLLDHILYDAARLRHERTLPTFTREALATGLPSEGFPTDHIALVADFSVAPRL